MKQMWIQACAVVGLVSIAGAQQNEIAKMIADDAVPGAYFGSCAVSGTLAVIGAVYDDELGPEAGAAYVFDLTDPTSPMQLHKLLPSDGQENSRFGASVGISGDVVVVGALEDVVRTGAAYVFSATTGEQLYKLIPDDGQPNDRFGISVAVDGAFAVVGADLADAPGDQSGAAYVFDVSTGEQLRKLASLDLAAGDRFGISAAIAGTTAIVGAFKDDPRGSESGSAYLFDVTTGEQLAKVFPADDGRPAAHCGIAVAIDDELAVVGCSRDYDGNGVQTGSVYVFDAKTGAEIRKLLADDGGEDDFFGASVATAGSCLVVGAVRDDDNGEDAGAAYVFDRFDGQQRAKLLPSDGEPGDSFGGAAFNGSMAVIGAGGDDDGGKDAGSAYVFAIGGCVGDLDGDSDVGFQDLLRLLSRWGPCDACLEDLDDDGDVDFQDLLRLLSHWGPCV